MAFIIETPNPFEPLVGLKKHTHSGGITIREWLGQIYPGFIEFDQPTICLVNGEPVLRKDWDRKIGGTDIVNFVAVIGDPATIIAIIVTVLVIVLSIVLVLMMPKAPGDQPTSDPVFSVKGQTNQIRLGEPIECCYGRNRIYPSLASVPFYQYQNNDQFQHSLFCLGQGRYDIEAIQIGDTPISTYQEVEWAVIPPGSPVPVALFPTNVHTSIEAGGQEMLDPVVVNPASTPFYFLQRTSDVVTFTTSQAHGLISGEHVRISIIGTELLQGFHGPEYLNVASIYCVDDVEVTVLSANSFTYLLPGPDGSLVSGTRYAPNGIGGFFLGTTDGFVVPIVADVIGWVGPFPANPSGTEAIRIEVDFVFPKGLYTIDKKGNVGPFQIVLEVMARLIDDSSSPLGDWFVLMNPTISAATTTPQRKTYGQNVDLGRYEVRVARASAKSFATNVGNDVFWEGLRGFLSGDAPNFGDVTLLAVKIRATNNLNSNTQDRFNVTCTRKLPIRSSSTDVSSAGEWSDPVITRSIVWALVDVFRSNYGGRILDDFFFDWDTLEALDAFYESRNEHFDWILRDPITVWTAAQMIAHVGRAVPLLVGSLITIKRDGLLEVPVTLFSPENMVKGTFEWDIKLWDLEEFDSASIEYTEPSTGYKQEHVLTVLPGGTSDVPEDVRLPGVQDRNHAYHEGLFYLASRRYLRENIIFETGMEGFIPSYGDLIAISHDVPRWSQSGYILAVEEGSGGVYSLFVSEPLLFDESGAEYQILLRGKQGQVIGPITAEPTSDPKVVTVTLAEATDFLLGGQTEPMLFLFGVAGRVTKYGKVVKIEPQGGENIKITAVNDAPIIHSFDGLVAPLLTFPSLPPVVPDLPVIPQLFLSQVDGTVLTIQASWIAAFGAQSYIIQTSEDNEHWQFRAQTSRTSIQLQTPPGLIFVRVAAINNGQGPWKQDSIKVGLIFGLEIFIPWSDLEWGIRWTNDINIDAYLIKVYDNHESSPILKRTVQQTEAQFIYTYEMAVTDSNVVSAMRVSVDAMIYDLPTQTLIAHGAPRYLDLIHTPPIPPAESSLGYEFVSMDASSVTYRLFWVDPIEGDTIRVEAWLSDVNGFDPTMVAPVYDFTSSRPGSIYVPVEVEVVVPLSAGNVHPDWYWRIAVGSVWSSGSGITDQETISPPWIVADGTWVDHGRWIDSDDWND